MQILALLSLMYISIFDVNILFHFHLNNETLDFIGELKRMDFVGYIYFPMNSTSYKY